MSDFDLYYWPLPFRGQFIRAILAYAGQDWTEHDSDENAALMARPPADQPVPFTGPPVLIDRRTGFALSQMPAIAGYLGERFGLTPDTVEARALVAKTANDANDVIDELTQFGGRQMWSHASWREFRPRLIGWMALFEEIGRRNGVSTSSGHFLATPEPSTADIIVSTLWSTMGDRFPPLADLCEEKAPNVWALSERMQNNPALAALRSRTRDTYGDAYCGGEIEASLRKVMR